jgi:microcystin-dependent protein
MTKNKRILASMALLGAVVAGPGHAGALPFIGEVMCGGWNFAPQGWLEANGQILSIAENTALFSLIGTTYGGDGQTTFALPDLRGRVIVHQGSSRVMGQSGGTESNTLMASQLPPHTHGYSPLASLSDATATSPAGNLEANKTRTTLYAPGPGDLSMQAVQTSTAGGAQPYSNIKPVLAVKCAIAIFGIYPSQN